jgi:hypothetical protein
LDGRAVVHVLQAADKYGTIPSLLDKYRIALQCALATVERDAPAVYRELAATWFTFLILAVRRRRRHCPNRPGLWRLHLDLARVHRERERHPLRIVYDPIGLL